MELLTHGGEHHEIGDGGWLMMTMAAELVRVDESRGGRRQEGKGEEDLFLGQVL